MSQRLNINVIGSVAFEGSDPELSKTASAELCIYDQDKIWDGLIPLDGGQFLLQLA